MEVSFQIGIAPANIHFRLGCSMKRSKPLSWAMPRSKKRSASVNRKDDIRQLGMILPRMEKTKASKPAAA